MPETLGEIAAQYWVEPSSAITYLVKAGQYIQIIDVEGSQCSDWLAFAAPDYTEELDNTVTRTLNATAVPKPGKNSDFYSQKMRSLAQMIQDTCGFHDTFFLACTSQYYKDLGYPDHSSCSENFNLVLQPYGISPRKGWAAVNFFYNTRVDPEGNITASRSQSSAGDYVLLRASCDLLCATSSCADDISTINGSRLSPIQVRIYGEEKC